VTLANWNSNNQVALAGPKPVLARVQQALSEKGYSVMQLPVSAAFHTPLVGHAQKPFADAIHATPFETPRIKVYSNSTGKQHASDPQVIREVLAAHILNPVLFKDEIESIYADGGYFFIEFGPKNVLTNLVKNILADKPHLAVALNGNAKKDSDRQLREAVLQLRVAGLPLTAFDPYQPVMKFVQPKKKSTVTITLNGGLYVSEKTRSAFDKALVEGHKIHTNGSNGKEILTPSAAGGVSKTPESCSHANCRPAEINLSGFAVCLSTDPGAYGLFGKEPGRIRETPERNLTTARTVLAERCRIRPHFCQPDPDGSRFAIQ